LFSYLFKLLALDAFAVYPPSQQVAVAELAWRFVAQKQVVPVFSHHNNVSEFVFI